MEAKRLGQVWAISLFVIGIVTMILAGAKLAGVKLPDMAIRIMGIFELIALFVLGFSTIKKLKMNG